MWSSSKYSNKILQFLKRYLKLSPGNIMEEETVIKEGQATVKLEGKVFYNPVQEFNRDLRLVLPFNVKVLSVFAKTYKAEKDSTKNGKIKERPVESKQPDDDINVIVKPEQPHLKCGEKYDDGITILEALSATGLRSIRYAKEIPGLKQIVANDISYKAVESIKKNVLENGVNHLVTSSEKDATMLMYEHKKSKFDAIDLDPYGCPSIFLDSAVQAVADGGLLLVTATDMAVLCGNSPETCYSKYGALSLHTRNCHEMALRILLQCIESHANRYGRYIVPLLSLSVDFYIRVFVRIYSGAHKCKFTTSKLSMVYHCKGCDSVNLQPLGLLKNETKQVKFGLPKAPPVGEKCEHCGKSQNMGGPIWSAPIHSQEFVTQVLHHAPETLTTYKRIQGVLNVILEELPHSPLYFTLEKLSSTLHAETPPMINVRSALLNAGYKVSYSHCHKASIKTDATNKVLWDIMRCWVALHPVSEKRLKENDSATNILATKSEVEYSFEKHPDANPESKRKGFVRFQENPQPHWGPGTRSTAMVGDNKIQKSRRNQGKRKREDSPEQPVNVVEPVKGVENNV